MGRFREVGRRALDNRPKLHAHARIWITVARRSDALIVKETLRSAGSGQTPRGSRWMCTC